MSHTQDMFTADPEGDPQEEAELTYLLQEAMHEFNLGPNGRCIEDARKFCKEHQKIDYHNPCDLPSYSVLHYDDRPSTSEYYDREDY